MPTEKLLKKKLQGVRSTQKLTKAMKTVSAVKYSRLNSMSCAFSEYSKCYLDLYSGVEHEIKKLLPPASENARDFIIVLGSNKGLCGKFNSELLQFAEAEIQKYDSAPFVAVLGKMAVTYFEDKKLPTDKTFNYNDIPQYGDCDPLITEITQLQEKGEISGVKVIYMKYETMMKQTPTVFEFFSAESKEAEAENVLYFPDKETVVGSLFGKLYQTAVYGMMLETALGAQASTLITMRSAYDTATEYANNLERAINRMRQTRVTADVIETASAEGGE